MADMVVSTTSNQVFAAFSFVGFILAIIPLPWHLESWNTGTCLYMLWASLSCLNYFVNAIVWNSHAINVAPIWCEISIRIIMAANIGIPAASLCINRRLYHISSLKSARITESEKRRGVLVDLAIGLGLPLISLPLAYITQGHRFDILEQIGCLPALYNGPLAFLFIWVPPLIIGLISGVYCAITIHTFNKRRTQFKAHLSGHNVNSNRYFRLMGLAALDLLCTVPIASYFIFVAVSNGVMPWASWADMHQNYSEIDLVPALLWHSDAFVARDLEFSRGLCVACAFVFFGFFGFAEEARKNYYSAYTSVAKRVGYSTGSMSSGATSTVGSKTPMTSSFGKGLISFGKKSSLVIVRQDITRTTDSDTLSSFKEKNSDRLSTGSVFGDLDANDFPSGKLSPPSSTSESSRSPSPIPRYNADIPTIIKHSPDMV